MPYGTQRDTIPNRNPIALEGFRALQASPLGVSVTIPVALLTASRDPTIEKVEMSASKIAPQRNLTNQGCE